MVAVMVCQVAKRAPDLDIRWARANPRRLKPLLRRSGFQVERDVAASLE